MKTTQVISATLGAAVLASTMGCATMENALSSPPEERDRMAAWGGLAGGAGGAIIGAFTGGAVAGGLFGIPLGAVAGYYIGDRMSSDQRSNRARDDEMNQLRRENERFRREAGFQGGGGMSDQQIRQVQMRLNQMGFHSGNIDGVWGPETQASLRNFQQSRNLQVTGQLNDQTARALGVDNIGPGSGPAARQSGSQGGMQQQNWQGQSQPSNQSGWQQSQQPANQGWQQAQQQPNQAWQQNQRQADANLQRPQQQAQAQQSPNQSPPPSQQQPMSGAQQQRPQGAQQGAMGAPAMTLNQQELRQVQQKLNDAGFNAGQVDGVWGPRTQAAVRNFQQSKNLQATGRLDQQTLNALEVR